MKKRHAIIKRTPIYNPSLRKISKIKSCCKFSNLSLGKSSFLCTKDCGNNLFMYFNKLTNSSKRAVLHYLDSNDEVPYAYLNTRIINNFDYVSWIVNEFTTRNLPVYLETDTDIPDDILNNLAKNSFNIVQCNINRISNSKEDYSSLETYNDIEQIRKLPYKLKISGVYTILSVNPIVPTITKLKDILILLTCEKYNFNHIIFKFISIPKTYNTLDYVTYNNIRIDSDYFELINNTWECAKWYKDIFIKNIKYIKKNLSYTICEEHGNCRKISINTSHKEDDMFFLN